MKRVSINTKENGNESAYKNGFSFPVLSGTTNTNNCSFVTFSGTTYFDYHSTSINNHENYYHSQGETTHKEYSICVDWIEFICTWDEPIELAFINKISPNIIIEKVSVHRNLNFRNLHRVFYYGVEACEIYSCANNSFHTFNEVSVKVANVLLYSDQYNNIINRVLDSFGLTFARYARIDIALDGSDIMKIIGLLNKYSKSHTIQCSNAAILILPTAFNKKELHWLSWSIGKTKSGISATVYDKTEEITNSRKEYIADYWSKNGISAEKVGRFEIHLNNKRLNKYLLDLSSLEKFADAEFIGSIFINEVKSWLKLYRVKKRDMMNHKKEVAIRKGKEIQFIKWEKLPTKLELLLIDGYVSNSTYISARNTISFNLHEILLHPDTSTTAQVEIIQKYAGEYDLQDYVNRKIRILFGFDIKDQYIQILKPLLPKGNICNDEP